MYPASNWAVLNGGAIGTIFQTTVGVARMSYVRNTLQTHYLKHSRPYKRLLENSPSTIKINYRVPNDARYEDCIIVVGRADKELQLTASFENSARTNHMEISTDKRKVVVNNCQDMKVKIQMNREQLEEIFSCK